MEREEIEKIKNKIYSHIEYIEHLQKKCDDLSESNIQLAIAKSNYYIALTNLI